MEIGQGDGLEEHEMIRGVGCCWFFVLGSWCKDPGHVEEKLLRAEGHSIRHCWHSLGGSEFWPFANRYQPSACQFLTPPLPVHHPADRGTPVRRGR